MAPYLIFQKHGLAPSVENGLRSSKSIKLFWLSKRDPIASVRDLFFGVADLSICVDVGALRLRIAWMMCIRLNPLGPQCFNRINSAEGDNQT